jgi:ERCC4-type nuclease
MMKLQIDSREKSPLAELVMKEATKLNLPYEKAWLEIGDYIYDDVCFEAKSSFDFLMSVMNKRLWNQIDNMDRAFNNNIIIMYGKAEDAMTQWLDNAKGVGNRFNNHRLIHNKFYGAIGKIILDTDCNIVWVPFIDNAAKAICVVCKMQPHEREVYTPRLIKKKISTTDLRIDVLTTIKGLSEKKAKKLIENHGSIMEIGEATLKELQEIEGIGATLASRINEVLNSEDKQVI